MRPLLFFQRCISLNKLVVVLSESALALQTHTCRSIKTAAEAEAAEAEAAAAADFTRVQSSAKFTHVDT